MQHGKSSDAVLRGGPGSGCAFVLDQASYDAVCGETRLDTRPGRSRRSHTTTETPPLAAVSESYSSHSVTNLTLA
jgi:hypothetical protein